MRKLLLIPLLALMCCISAWAADVNYSSYASMQNAVTAAGAGGKITISDNLTLSSSVDFNGCTLVTAKNKRLTFSGTATYQNFVFNPVNFGAYVVGDVIFENANLSTVNVTTNAASNITLRGNITLPIFKVSHNSSITNETNVSVAVTGTSNLTLTNVSGATFTFTSATDFGGNNLTITGAGSIAIEPGAQFKKSAWDGCSALATYCTNNNLHPEPWAVSGAEYVKVFATAQNHVAQIGAVGYPTLSAAVAAAAENATIDLTDAVNEAEVKISKNLTISGGTACKTLNCYFNITGEKTLKLINVTVQPTAGSYAVQLYKNTKLILSNANIVGREANSAIKVYTSTANTTCQIESEAGTSNTIRNTASTSTSTYTINGNKCVLEFMGNGNLLVEHTGTGGYLFGGNNGNFKLNAPNAIYTYETAGHDLKNTAVGALEHLQGIYSSVIESYEEGGHTVYPVSNANQLKLALNTASDNDVIRLNDGLIALTEQVVIDKTLTIDFRGCELYSENMMNIDNLIKVGKDASSTNTVTFTSTGALDGGVWAYAGNGGVIDVYSNAIFDRGVIENRREAEGISIYAGRALNLRPGANVTINGGTFRSHTCVINTERNDGADEINLTINNGTFSVSENSLGNSSCITMRGNISSGDANRAAYNTTVTINGGTFSGANSGVNVAGKGAVLNVTGGTISGAAYAIAGNGTANSNGTVINITSGTVGSATTAAGIYHPQGGTLNISGDAHVIGETGVQLCAGYSSAAATEVVGGSISGGTIEAVGADDRANKTGDGLIPDGAAISVVNRNYPGGTPQFQIVSGIFKSVDAEPLKAYTWSNNAASAWPDDQDVRNFLQAIGGYFSANPFTYVLGDYTVNEVHFDNGTYYMVHKGNVTSAQDFIDSTGDEVVKLTKEDESDPSLEVVVGDNVGTETEQVAEYVEVSEDVTLIVKDNATLTVGDGGLVLADENSTMEVEAGGIVIVGANGIVSTDESNIVLNASEEKHSTLLLNPNVTLNTTPKATYRFTSKAFADGETWVYQRFGMPTYDGNVTVKVVDNSFNGDSWLAKWNYETDQWGAWNALTSSEFVVSGAQPFQGYLLASNNARNTQMVYEFTGNLMGNTDANLHFYYGWNFYANSYTAPISIVDFVETVKQSLNSNDILATIYLYKDLGNDTYTWQAVNQGNAGDLVTVGFEPGVGPIYEQLPSNIKPMQAFMMKLNKQGEAYQEIDYANNVYGPAINSGASSAPARDRQANNKMQVSVYNAEGFDKVFFIENENFSDALDNGYDAYKCDQNKGVQLYAMNNSEHMEIMATDNIEGTFIGIDAPKAGSYTLHFSDINGMEYAIVDMENNTTINIAEGAEYTFSAAKGQNDYRFQIVEAAKMPTAIDNTEVKSAIKGIYTITGQYLGEDFNRVPAGIYIVNGVKVVK